MEKHKVVLVAVCLFLLAGLIAPQVAFADSGFTAEHGDLPFASVARVTEDLLQPGYLTVASNRGGVELGRLNPAIPPSERS